MFLEVNKPKPVVLFEMVKGWATGTAAELGDARALAPGPLTADLARRSMPLVHDFVLLRPVASGNRHMISSEVSMAHQCVVAIPLVLACAIGSSVKLDAQTAIVPINHPVSGNFTFRLLDLNTATANELTKVLGLDEALATRIIQGRPYLTANELIERRLIPATTYARIENRLVVKNLPR